MQNCHFVGWHDRLSRMVTSWNHSNEERWRKIEVFENMDALLWQLFWCSQKESVVSFLNESCTVIRSLVDALFEFVQVEISADDGVLGHDICVIFEVLESIVHFACFDRKEKTDEKFLIILELLKKHFQIANRQEKTTYTN